jgi:hypothetical protein
MPTEQDYHKALMTRDPFWISLSPTAVKRRLDQILNAPDAAAIVRQLSPVEYVVLLKESPETRSQLLALATPHQVRTTLDLDCWHKDSLQSTRVLAWVDELQHSGPEVFIQALSELDVELLIATFRKHVRVHATLPSEEEDDPGYYDEVLSNELYRIEFIDQNTDVQERIRRILNTLRMSDLNLYHGLMQHIMWGQESESEHWAHRWKSGRLQDEGFPDYYEALETYRLSDLEQPLPPAPASLPSPGSPESAEASGLVPAYAWSLTPSDSFLAQALLGEVPTATQERLCWEMVYLCNRELIVDQIDFAEAAAVRASLARVHAYLNMGLEYLSGYDIQQLVPLLTRRSLQEIFQIGFTLSIRLHQRALHLQTHLNRGSGVRRALSGLGRRVLDGLLRRPPQFFEGLLRPGLVAYRDFSHLQDVALVDPVLTTLERHPASRLGHSGSPDLSLRRA